jgi:sugar lactone lactonase YvrE
MATATAKSIHATASAPTPDLVAVYKRITSAVMAAGSPRVIASHLSPDGGWRAELIRYDCVNEGGVDENAYEMLRLVNVEDGVERLVADQLQYCGGIGAYGLGFVYWSADSRYLYYTESAHGVPDGDATAWYRSLFRYDVLSDETIDLRWGPLAPDGVSMAYPDPRELALVIWDLDRGEIARIPSSLPPDSPGAALYGIAWSPDGKSLVYIEAENAYGSTSRSWIVQLDLATFHRQVIYQSESGTLCCVEWRIPGQIQFKVDYWEPQILKVPPMETETLQPSSLWFDRQEDLKDTLPESFLPQIITNGHEILLINNLIKFA